MKLNTKILSAILLATLACGSTRTGKNQILSPHLYQKWMNSHEEDDNQTKIYRPADFDFPPSRGRTGFEIKENGDYIEYGLGPTDIPTKTSGIWELSGSSLAIDFGDQKKGYTLSILSVTPEKLTLER